jgi:diadenosine tetraphosphate (Ap4A) HIT family hydrolase
MYKRKRLTEHEIADYSSRSQDGPCFVCQVISDEASYKHHIIFENDEVIVFLNMTQPMYGYTLLAPKKHIERVVSDLELSSYLSIQRMIHAVGNAVERTVDTERLYLLSLGSQQGNRYVHWHIAPLPPGVHYHEQQLAALDHDAGYLDINDSEKAELASRIRQELLAILESD